MSNSPKIVFCSILKPVDEPRFYEKMACSLAEDFPEMEFHMIGQPGKNKSSFKNITFHSLFNFHRASLKRLFTFFKLFKAFKKLNPNIIIMGTHEVIWPVYWYKLLNPRCHLVYDVQENYRLNILNSEHYKKLTKKILSWYISYKENLIKNKIKAFWVAERCYFKELTFLHTNSIYIPNTYKSPPGFILHNSLRKDFQLKLVVTGTISKVYGIFNAIDLVKRLLPFFPNLSFQIVGVCHDKNTRSKIENDLLGIPNSEFIGGEFIVNHETILHSIEYADFCLIPYEENDSIKKCVPTKIYECMALKTPTISVKNPLWETISIEGEHCLYIDYKKPNIGQLVQLIKNNQFFQKEVPSSIFWNTTYSELKSSFHKLK